MMLGHRKDLAVDEVDKRVVGGWRQPCDPADHDCNPEARVHEEQHIRHPLRDGALAPHASQEMPHWNEHLLDHLSVAFHGIADRALDGGTVSPRCVRYLDVARGQSDYRSRET
jgi:hypothetical protein